MLGKGLSLSDNTGQKTARYVGQVDMLDELLYKLENADIDNS